MGKEQEELKREEEEKAAKLVGMEAMQIQLQEEEKEVRRLEQQLLEFQGP